MPHTTSCHPGVTQEAATRSVQSDGMLGTGGRPHRSECICARTQGAAFESLCACQKRLQYERSSKMRTVHPR